MQRLILTATGVLAAFALCSCGAGGNSVDTSAAASGKLTARLDTATSLNAAGVVLDVSGSLDNAVLSATGLANTKALYGQIDYDPATTHFVGGAPVTGASPDDMLTLVVDRPQDSCVYFGLVLTDYEQRHGLDGQSPLFKLNFAPGAAAAGKRVDVAPTSIINVISLSGTLDAANKPTLTWKEALPGDGDNNGEVNQADLQPIAKFFKQTYDKNTEGDTEKADADYDGNGEVNPSDITPIGQNFKATVGGYRIRTSTDGTSFVDFEDVPRATMFPPPVAKGGLTWTWTGPALSTVTYFQVEPYDRDNPALRGRPSADEVKLTPITSITYTNVNISFTGESTWPANRKAANGDYIVLLTENSIDSKTGNAEPFATESLQLVVTAEDVNNPGVPIDITDKAYMGLSEGAGLASVSLVSASRGKLTFRDRGKITVQTFAPGDFLESDTISFDLLSINSLAITSTSGATPQGISGGGTLQFVATGTFDMDNQSNGNEIQQDVTAYSAWGGQPAAGNAGDFILRTDIGAVQAGTAQTGDLLDVYAEFPPTDDVLLYDNLPRSAGPFTVFVN